MEDYKSAAIRHFEDADFLRLAGKLDNAGHLIGFAAECAIKHRISTFNNNGDRPHGHFPEFLTIARKHLHSRTEYTRMYDVLKSDIFQNWSVNRRYLASSTTTNAEVDDWFLVTKRLFATAGFKGRR